METEFLIKLGLNIKKIRKENGITQEKLSELTDLSPNFISLLESGKKRPSIKTISKLSKALNVPMHKFFIFSKENISDYKKESSKKKLSQLIKNLNHNDILFVEDLIKTLKKYKKNK